MRVRDVMTTEVVCCSLGETAQAAAKLMKMQDVGAIPVVADLGSMKLEGIVTDRDLCCSVVAEDESPHVVRVLEVMTRNPVTCKAEDTLDHCGALMKKFRVRRLPVVDQEGRCIGIIAQGDLARHTAATKFKDVVATISTPTHAKRAIHAVA